MDCDNKLIITLSDPHYTIINYWTVKRHARNYVWFSFANLLLQYPVYTKDTTNMCTHFVDGEKVSSVIGLHRMSLIEQQQVHSNRSLFFNILSFVDMYVNLRSQKTITFYKE